MAPAVAVTTGYSSRSLRLGRGGVIACVLALCTLLPACSSTPGYTRHVDELPPLQLASSSIEVSEVNARIQTPDLLALNDDMRDFVELYTGRVRSPRQRLSMLHRAITGAGAMDLQYDPFAEGTAQEVFHRGSANCLSYASLFVALAREADLDAGYQWLEVRPQWTRMGERVMVRLHVNVRVRLDDRSEYMVDIDPLPTQDIADTRPISDSDAEALYHNNIAMDALANNDLEQAWLHAVRAIQISPKEAELWVNLGAIYRHSDQLDEAERNYLYALQLDPKQRSAMNNLSVLYGMQGREADSAYWLAQVDRYRDSNPYYHAWLGDKAADSADWHEALQHYQEAIDLLPGDSGLLYATGLIYYQLDDLPRASGYIERAIEAATLNSERKTYQLRLESVQREQLAGA